jgi:FkbM family methyltransferase
MKIRTASANPGYRFGTTEPDAQRIVAESLRPGDVCYDLGANVGFFTLIAAKAVGETGAVYAFEPFTATASELRENIRLNLLETVTVIEAAVCDEVGQARMNDDGDSLRGKLSESGNTLVPTTTLDALDLRPPNFVKIDVEGAEKRAIAGMRETIERHRPTILCEMHLEGTAEDAATRLGEWLPGYSVEPLESGWCWAPHVLATPHQHRRAI